MPHHERSATTVYLVRHGSVVGAETRRFIGHLDVPLSPLGERQIAAVAEHLSATALDAVYSSDLVRTRRSAAIIAEPHGLVPIERSALREFAMGRWEGLTGEEIRALDADAHSTWMADIAGYQFPDGENLAQLSARAWPAFEEIVAAHPGGALAIVAHGGTNRVLLCRALGVAPAAHPRARPGLCRAVGPGLVPRPLHARALESPGGRDRPQRLSGSREVRVHPSGTLAACQVLAA